MADAVTAPHRTFGVDDRQRRARVLIYSHDTFGLGHLRRSRAIANALVADRPGISVVIVSGSPVIGSFEFGRGVDYVRVPGVTKLPDGNYRSLNLNIPLDEAVHLRESIIRETAESFAPDLMLVDKEPTGFRGEVVPALELLRDRGSRIVLGVRDVLDEPAALVPEWQRKGAVEILDRFYDEIWIYGLDAIYRPLAAIGLPERLVRATTYTGYLRREMPEPSSLARYPKLASEPFILVTTGGGGDGDNVIDWVISAYEADSTIMMPALIVFGPFIDRERRQAFLARIGRHPKLDAIAFDTKLELLMRRASAVVAMGGYNTFCEILSFDKPTLIVPRVKPRREQLIRAEAAERLGLARMLNEDGGARDPARMAAALAALPGQPRPSEIVVPGLLDGLDVIRTRFDAGWLARPLAAEHRQAAEEMASPSKSTAIPTVAVVVKGYPRLSETFIAQELLGLERRGVPLRIWSLRRPTERIGHPMHREIAAPVSYLPEYLYQETWRVLRGVAAALRQPAFGRLLRVFAGDLRRDRTANRMRRLGQAFVLARELPAGIRHIHVHFLHTPASVVRYAALLTGRTWSFSAHAKDIWTIPDWEKREKLAAAAWGVTCTAFGARHLDALVGGRVRLLYHGLDLGRFPEPPPLRPARDGRDETDPIRILSVGRAVPKKGYDDLLRALTALPGDLHWRFAHVGGGEGLARLRAGAERAGLGERAAFLGPKSQPDVIALMREADLFVLPSKAAADGDRDGLPNVIMEAASQALATVASDFAGIPEFLRAGRDGELVAPGDWEALSNALNLLGRDPERRQALGRSARARLVSDFSAEAGLDWLAARFGVGTDAVEPELAMDAEAAA